MTRGRTTLRQAIEFIGRHQHEPETWTVDRIADEYKLKNTVVGKCFTLTFNKLSKT